MKRLEKPIVIAVGRHTIREIVYISLPEKYDSYGEEEDDAAINLVYIDENGDQQDAVLIPAVANILASMWGKNDRIA